MKKVLIILVCCLAGVAASAQVYLKDNVIYGREFNRLMADSAQHLPSKTSLRTSTVIDSPQLFVLNDTALVWYARGVFHIVGGSGSSGSVFDTTSLSNRINLRVKYSDTAAMLAPYLRLVDANALFYPLTSNPANYSVLPNVVNSLQVINAGNFKSAQSGTYATRPPPGILGRYYVATDSSAAYFDNGSVWLDLRGSGGSGGPGLAYPGLPRRYLNGYGQWVTTNTDSINTEGTTNKWYLDSRARAAISLAPGSAGTYNPSTGQLFIPAGSGGGVGNVGSFYRLYAPQLGGLRTIAPLWGMKIDSSSNANALSFGPDTTTGFLATQGFVTRSVQSIGGDITLTGSGPFNTTVNKLKNVTLPGLSAGYLYFDGANFVFQTPGAIAPGDDTVAVINLGGGVALASTNNTDTMRFRTITAGYGVLVDTLVDRSLRLRADTASLTGLASKTTVNNYFGDSTKTSLNIAMNNSSFLGNTHTVTGQPVIWANGLNAFSLGLKLGALGAPSTSSGAISSSSDSAWYTQISGIPVNLMRSLRAFDSVSTKSDSSKMYFWRVNNHSTPGDSVAFVGATDGSGGSPGASGYQVYNDVLTPSTSGANSVSVYVDEYRVLLPDLTSTGISQLVSWQTTGTHTTTQKIVIYNRNANATYKWNVDGSDTRFYDKTGTVITSLTNQTTYVFDFQNFDGTRSNWFQE